MFSVDVAFQLPASDPPADSGSAVACLLSYHLGEHSFRPHPYQLQTILHSCRPSFGFFVHNPVQEKCENSGEKAQKCLTNLYARSHRWISKTHCRMLHLYAFWCLEHLWGSQKTKDIILLSSVKNWPILFTASLMMANCAYWPTPPSFNVPPNIRKTCITLLVPSIISRNSVSAVDFLPYTHRVQRIDIFSCHRQRWKTYSFCCFLPVCRSYHTLY